MPEKRQVLLPPAGCADFVNKSFGRVRQSRDTRRQRQKFRTDFLQPVGKHGEDPYGEAGVFQLLFLRFLGGNQSLQLLDQLAPVFFVLKRFDQRLEPRGLGRACLSGDGGRGRRAPARGLGENRRDEKQEKYQKGGKWAHSVKITKLKQVRWRKSISNTLSWCRDIRNRVPRAIGGVPGLGYDPATTEQGALRPQWVNLALDNRFRERKIRDF